jgi:hypothetical protein
MTPFPWNGAKLPLYAALTLTLLSGAALRFVGLNWDQGQGYHADEVEIANAVARLASPGQSDPQFYVYNGLPLYLYANIGRAISWWSGDPAWRNSPEKITRIGRAVSATVSTISLFLIYLLGAELASLGCGLLAAGLATFSVGLTQQAHFAVTESLLVFFLLLIAIETVWAAKRRAPWIGLLIGLTAGLAIGTKTTAVSFMVIPATAWLFQHRGRPSLGSLAKAALSLGVAALTFAAVSPYSILHRELFWQQMRFEHDIVRGARLIWFNVPFLGTNSYIAAIENLVWAAGPIVAPLGAVGIACWTIVAVRRRNPSVMPLLVFTIAYFLYVGSWFTQFSRYIVLLVPSLALGAAWVIVSLSATRMRAAIVLGVFTLAISAVWAISFSTIYTRLHTRLAASDWIYANARPGSLLLLEMLDPKLPAPRPGGRPEQNAYRVNPCIQLDDAENISNLLTAVAEADYLVLSSRRCSDAVLKLPNRYPVSAAYYRKLFSGGLGYVLAARFRSDPSVGPLHISDDAGESTRSVFDHPVVSIFRNTHSKSVDELRNLLLEDVRLPGPREKHEPNSSR